MCVATFSMLDSAETRDLSRLGAEDGSLPRPPGRRQKVDGPLGSPRRSEPTTARARRGRRADRVETCGGSIEGEISGEGARGRGDLERGRGGVGAEETGGRRGRGKGGREGSKVFTAKREKSREPLDHSTLPMTLSRSPPVRPRRPVPIRDGRAKRRREVGAEWVTGRPGRGARTGASRRGAGRPARGGAGRGAARRATSACARLRLRPTRLASPAAGGSRGAARDVHAGRRRASRAVVGAVEAGAELSAGVSEVAAGSPARARPSVVRGAGSRRGANEGVARHAGAHGPRPRSPCARRPR